MGFGIREQHDLHSEFQADQCYTVRSCLKQTKNPSIKSNSNKTKEVMNMPNMTKVGAMSSAYSQISASTLGGGLRG